MQGLVIAAAVSTVVFTGCQSWVLGKVLATHKQSIERIDTDTDETYRNRWVGWCRRMMNEQIFGSILVGLLVGVVCAWWNAEWPFAAVAFSGCMAFAWYEGADERGPRNKDLSLWNGTDAKKIGLCMIMAGGLGLVIALGFGGMSAFLAAMIAFLIATLVNFLNMVG